ncbi:hypothetical protein GVN16_10780 [Emticicia sp. CRIBPO]|uniref:hypothetical protein n=1 Tax=Emticicia sp. CRIBPO TaxID=2683258 RepID=UPI0014122EEE|nr:hypothetical protein [Emticicia sp. CRIBPO]NBA86249.1 hypothetical protein [Emticicia sp. CRIBPO]
MKKLILMALVFAFSKVSAQSPELFDSSKQWILTTTNIKKNELRFVEYNVSKLSLNTMIWNFRKGGKIEYDYQSREGIDACAGVNFLDLDVDECSWTYNPANMKLTMTLKGGYASIDDFVLKREYTVSVLDDGDGYGYKLTKTREYFFNDLTRGGK